MGNTGFRIKLNSSLFIICILCILSNCAFADKISSALKLLNKGSFEKTKTLLNRSLSKEKINPGAKYVYSLYFIKTDNPAFNLDSSYAHILGAMAEYPNIKESDKKKLEKLKINDSTLILQKETIEGLAFAEASNSNTEDSYIRFLEKFPYARQHTEALKRRDDRAYHAAEDLNTSKSYALFLEKYPQATLAPRAKENYDLKLFQESTGTGNLQGYIDFLERNPGSPYRLRAEEKVFKIFTVLNQKGNYEDFINKFPVNGYLNDAWNYLLFHYIEEKKVSEFLAKYPNSPLYNKASAFKTREDSSYYVFYDNKQFGFINELGGQLTNVRFEGVFENYLCSGAGEEFIIFSQDDKFGAVDKAGNPILPAEYAEIQKIGTATLRVKEGKVFSLYLMNGKRVSREEFEDIEKLNNSFLKVKFNGKWGLRGINGCEILDPSYDDIIFVEKDFYLVRKGDSYALLKGKDLVAIAENGKSHLDFKYGQFEEINESFLEIGSHEKLGILNQEHQQIIEPQFNSITYNKKCFIAKGNSGLEIFDLEGKPLSANTYNQIVPGYNIFAVKQGGKWGIIDKAGKTLIPMDNDSILLIGDKVSIAYKGNLALGLFNFNNIIALPEHEKVEVQTAGTRTKDSTRTQYLLLEDKDGKVDIFNKVGKPFFKNVYDKITVITENFFIVEQRGKVGVIDSLGKLLLPLKYDAIGKSTDGYVSLLKSSKFGLFNPASKMLIQPKFDALIKVFDPAKKIFLAMDNGNYAFIDPKGKALSEHKFKEVNLWKGDTVLAKEGNSFFLYSIRDKKEVSEGFESVKFIKDSSREKLAMVRNNQKYGILSNKKGYIIPIKYNDITNLGMQDKPFYMAEHHVEEADYYVVLYFNYLGKLVMSQAYKSADYDKLLCQD